MTINTTDDPQYNLAMSISYIRYFKRFNYSDTSSLVIIEMNHWCNNGYIMKIYEDHSECEELCGNGITTENEVCDDGNIEDGDG